MHSKTLQLGLWVGLACNLWGMEATAKATATEYPGVTVSVFNDARVPPAILQSAEDVAGRVFAWANIHVEWMNCGRDDESALEREACQVAAFPKHLHVRVIEHALTEGESTLGLSYMDEDGSGCQADIFYLQVARVAAQSPINVSTMLGNAIAHEIGHLLLGHNAHSANGIMRARWGPSDVEAASKNSLTFSRQQKLAMKATLNRASATIRTSTNLAR